MHKGHKDFKTVVSNVDRGELLEILDTHKSEEIIEMLMQQPTEVREAVEEVSIDMWGGFSKVVAFVFPNAVVVFDRFHVMKSVNEELNKIRKQAGVTDKHSKYLLLKNATDLNQEQKDKLEEILARSICLRIAYELKEELRAIYETNQSVKSARRSLNKWLQIAQVFYQKSTRTIRTHFDGICN